MNTTATDKASASAILTFWALLAAAIAIGYGASQWVNREDPNAGRLEAYGRCVALIDNGARWDESEEGWRCRVEPVETGAR